MASIDTFLLDLLKATVALFVIVDPLGPVPIFAGLTKTMNLDEKRKVFRTAAVVGAILLAAFALIGQEVLLLFGISLESFQIAGGLVLLLLSIEIIFRGERMDKLTLVSAEETAVFPIAFPLLVGPGAITLTLISIRSSGIMVALISIVIVMFVSWVVLRQTDRIYRMLGKTGAAVIARVMSLLSLLLLCNTFSQEYSSTILRDDAFWKVSGLEFGETHTLELLVHDENYQSDNNEVDNL